MRRPISPGKLDGSVKVKGSGRSAAEILGASTATSACMRDAAISHLAMRCGVDLAQALG
jgi:hypothetical protein